MRSFSSLFTGAFLSLTLFAVCQAPTSVQAASEPLHSEIAGENLLDGSRMKLLSQDAKATVVVFLSAFCPCSNSHLKELAALANEYSDVRFVGVHSNANEPRDVSVAYFTKAHLPFPVIEDEKFKLADEYRAFKTPHSYVLNSKGEIVYRGGVSNSHDIEKSDRKFLREALDDLKASRTIRTPEGRTMGCAISRG